MNIIKAELVAMGTSEEHFPKDGKPEVMLLGRSNVGKSSFINTLANRKNLAYTSSNPGKTRTINFYNINDALYLVDVPGYGYAKVTKQERLAFGQMIEKYLTTRKELKLAVLLVDFRHQPTEDDLLMYNYLKYYNIKTLIVATKADKIGVTKQPGVTKKLKADLNLSHEDFFIPFSAITRLNREEVWNIINSQI